MERRRCAPQRVESEMAKQIGRVGVRLACLCGNGMRLVVPARCLDLGQDEFPAGVGFGRHSLGEAEIGSQRQSVLPYL